MGKNLFDKEQKFLFTPHTILRPDRHSIRAFFLAIFSIYTLSISIC